MCGICGAVRTEVGPPLDEGTIIRMRDCMVHRGPDAAGQYLDGFAGLGHRRLSIVDVAHGHQPMHSAEGRYVLVYNGEIYNHPELRPVLEREGMPYHTNCDTETVLHLFERYGIAAPTHMRGMFAIALWDRRDRTLILARDRFGVKPLYYALLADGTLLFASEIKSLFESGKIRPAVNEGMLPDFLANHAPSGEETLFAGVRRLPPGHTLTWQDGKITMRQYWDLRFSREQASEPSGKQDAELAQEYLERFTEAVRLRLMADVPLGMFLSGGIDSAAITAVMSRLVPDRIKTFSVAFAEREANELAYARLVAKRYNTDHHEVVVSPADFFESLPSLVWHEDEPIAHPSSIALNFVSRLAARHVKVVLTGEGSDETLAGYNRYRVTVYNARLGALYERIIPGFARAVVRNAISALPARMRARQRAERTFLTRSADLDDLYFDNFAVFGRHAQLSLLAPDVRARLEGINPYAAFHDAMYSSDAIELLDRLLYADTRTYLHELLMKQDQMSMAASIESRVPFLDHELVQWVSRLPNRFKLRGTTTKWILREAMKDRLPAEVLSRGKMGFPVPFGQWVRGPWRHLLDDFVLGERAMERQWFQRDHVRRIVEEHERGTRNHSERLWALLNFEVWNRVYIDGEGKDMNIKSMAPAVRAA